MKHYPLQPLIHDWIELLITREDFLDNMIEKFKSPVNILNIDPFLQNVLEYQKAFESCGVQGKVFYARKSNKCLTLLGETKKGGYGIDTASLRELTQSLERAHSDDIVFTAAVKTDEALSIAISNNVLIIVDNEDELENVISIARQEKNGARIGFRLTGFMYQGEALQSRFGFDLNQINELAEKYCVDQHDLHYEGLHFHLDGYSLDQRSAALIQCIRKSEELKALGLTTQFIDIGGGLLMNYLKSRDEWEAFHKGLKSAVLEKTPPITYKNDGLGLINHKNKLIGKANVYPFYNELNKGNALKYILNAERKINVSIADELVEKGIELRIEPGRSLLDQVGVTVARVAHVKKDARNDYLVGLEMNMSQLASGSRDFLVDPIHIKRSSEQHEKAYGYLTGAYCLERDIILKRKLEFKTVPRKGDLFLFINTAGYMMHFFESMAHQFELAKNIFIDPASLNDDVLYHLDKIEGL